MIKVKFLVHDCVKRRKFLVPLVLSFDCHCFSLRAWTFP